MKKDCLIFKNKRGFTLVELIVVIAILVILIALMVPQVLSYIQTAEEFACNANMETLCKEYTSAAVWHRYSEAGEARLVMEGIAENHKLDSDEGTMYNAGLYSGGCPAGGQYGCEFADDSFYTVIISCSKHGSIKLDAVALQEHLSNMTFPAGFIYSNLNAYYDKGANRVINSEAKNTGADYSPYTSLAEAVEDQLKDKGVNFSGRTWAMKRNSDKESYTLVLASSKLTVADVGTTVKCEMYDTKTGKVVTGTATVRKDNSYAVIDMNSFKAD